MRNSFFHFLAASAIGATLALSVAGSANAESVMAACGAQWKAAKTAGTTNGLTWPQFLSQCRTQQPSGNAAPAPTTYAPAPAPATNAPSAVGKTAAECDAEYSANKAAIKASGQKKKDYVAACRAGTVATAAPAPSAPMAPAPAPTTYAPAPAPAPASTIWPWQKPQTPEPQPQVAMRPTAPMSASEAQAQASCPSDTVVWLNTKSGVYHYRGTHNYGSTKQGTYMCEASAKASGDRAAMNEKHP